MLFMLCAFAIVAVVSRLIYTLAYDPMRAMFGGTQGDLFCIAFLIHILSLAGGAIAAICLAYQHLR